MNWDNISSYCYYLELINNELECKLNKIQKQVKKLSDIYEKIRPIEIKQNKEPTEDPEIRRLIIKAKRLTEKSITQEITIVTDPYLEYQKYKAQYLDLEVSRRKTFSKEFLSSLFPYTKPTQLSSFNQLLPFVLNFNHFLDKLIQISVRSPLSEYRIKYAIQKAENLFSNIENQFKTLGELKKLSCPIPYKELPPQLSEPNQTDLFAQIVKNIPNIPIEQLTTREKLRGRARLAYLELCMKSKLNQISIDPIRELGEIASSLDDIELTNELKFTAQTFSAIGNHTSYGIIEEPYLHNHRH